MLTISLRKTPNLLIAWCGSSFFSNLETDLPTHIIMKRTAILATLIISTLLFPIASCKKIRKGILEIKIVTNKILNTPDRYIAILVDDDLYEPETEFLYTTVMSNVEFHYGYYWPKESARSLGYKHKCSGENPYFTAGDECDNSMPGENGHWMSSYVASTGATGNSGGTNSSGGSAGTSTTSTDQILLDVTISGNTYDRKSTSVVIPAGLKSVTFRTHEPDNINYKNSADMFVRKGSAPVVNHNPPKDYTYTWTADFAGIAPNREEEVYTISNPSSGTYYILLFGYNTYFTSRLTVTGVK